jgi:hypothetical protein
MLTSADVPDVSCASVDPAVAAVLTAVAAVPTAVDFLLLRMFQTSLLAALCVSEEDLRSPNIRERNGKKSGSQKREVKKE